MKKPQEADGRFDLTKNRLAYWLNEPVSWRRKYNLPSKILFEGRWQLNSNHDLELILSKTRNQYKDDRLRLRGEIISADKDEFVFELESIDKKGLDHIQLLKLSGAWSADDSNRIIFIAEKKRLPDTLILKNGWQINKNQQIEYTYEKVNLKTKTRSSHSITFEGFWQINSSRKLTYILSRSTKSIFEFRAQIESPNLYPKDKAIKYRLGLGLRKERLSRMSIISLYGTWKFSRKAGLSFEVDYGSGKLQAIRFGTDIYLGKRDEMTLALLNKENEPLGVNIVFTHRFLKRLDAKTFLRLKKSAREAGIEAGVRIPF